MNNINNDLSYKHFKISKGNNTSSNSKKNINNKKLSRTININFINSNSSQKKTHNSNSSRLISEFPENINNGEKLTMRTTVISKKEKMNNDPNKYHINFDLLENAGINSTININMTFI